MQIDTRENLEMLVVACAVGAISAVIGHYFGVGWMLAVGMPLATASAFVTAEIQERIRPWRRR